MSILEWKVILKMQHTLLIAIKCLTGYFFFKMIKAVGGLLEAYLTQMLAIFK